MGNETLIRRQNDPDANFGIVDIRDGAWLGDSRGPVYYEDEQVARVAASMFAVQIGISRTKFAVRPNDRGKLKHAGEVGKFQCTAEEALQKIENGEVL